MPTVFALIPDNAHFLDAQANPASGALLFVYTAGSTTKATTYTESDGAVANTNPIVLNSRGEMPSGCYVASGTYKTVLAPSNDTDPPTSPYRTRDNLSPTNDTTTTVNEFASSGLTPTFVNSTQFTLVGDQRTEFHVGRRLKTANSGGTGYHTITAVAFTSLTTVTVSNDSVTLDSGLSSVDLSILSADNSAVPSVITARGDIIRGSSAGLAERLAIGTSGQVPTSDGTDVGYADIPLPPGWLNGLTLSNGTDSDHDIDIAAGKTRDGGDAANLVLSAAITKQIDATWAVGDDAGGMESGTSVSTNTWYSMWLIRRSDTGVVDALFSDDASSPTMPTDYDQKRRIGWVRTDASSNIIGFVQNGDRVRYTAPGTVGLDESNLSVSASEATATLDFCPPSVEGILNVGVTATERASVWVYPTTVDSAAVDIEASVLPNVGGDGNGAGQPFTVNMEVRVDVDASRQIHLRSEAASRTVDIQVMGWTDTRGQ